VQPPTPPRHARLTGSSVAQVFERLTERARTVLVLAQEEARALHHGYIGTEHILLGLITEGDGVGAYALGAFGVTLPAVRHEVAELLGEAKEPVRSGRRGSPPFTPRAKKVLELSWREALRLGHKYIGTEHLLLGIISEGEGVAAQVLVRLGIDLESARLGIESIMSGWPVEGPLIRSAAGTVVQSAHMERSNAEPRCPQCHAPLSQEARFRTMLVPPDTDEGAQEPRRTIVVYCGACGVSLHMFTESA
jgi:ATP-dependent Clp protease ATP-binding subunit ClpA